MKVINVKQILWYFIIFSIIGLIIETSYCYLTTGVLESRKGFLIGPFCPIYGVGAATIIAVFGDSKKSRFKLFLEGLIFGTLLEYVLSYILEAIYGMKFWNYSYLKYNINGRISLVYSVFWGILTSILIRDLAPQINKLIKKIPDKKIITISIIIFFIIDSIITIWAIQTYKNRVINNKTGNYIEETFFSNETMRKIFPNLRIKDENGEEHFLREYL